MSEKAKKDATTESEPRYFALHEAGLQNGSFFRVRGETICAQYINGDFMGNVGTLPKTYNNHPLKEFPRNVAERLIPKCCLPPGHSHKANQSKRSVLKARRS